ncbi:MAG: sigma-70 family RNA polymerase sigma factor [Chloroflexota bacterium]|nr:sigma-70 family RNA polymerase sigma factor [Chloroflexota bacterium]
MAAPKHASSDSYLADPALVQACIDGDEGAWDEFIARYGRLVYSIPLRSGFSRDDADDIFQNVCAIVLRDLHTLRDQARLSSWLITTTHRECWRLRKRSTIHTTLDETLVDASTPPPEDVLRWEREQVRDAIWRLNDRCRTLLTALFLDPDEPSYDQVAERLGVPLGSVGPTRARCFKKLEAVLLEMGFEPDP